MDAAPEEEVETEVRGRTLRVERTFYRGNGEASESRWALLQIPEDASWEAVEGWTDALVRALGADRPS
jgi:hypothetical protein